MRRDHFTVTATNIDRDSGAVPTIDVAYSGPAGTLTARLESDTGDIPEGDELDAAFRHLSPHDEAGATGVFSLSRRLTGDFVLEANADADAIGAVVDAARDGDEAEYRIRIQRPGADDVVFEKETLLVYDDEGSLLRQHSLIPGGVEL